VGSDGHLEAFRDPPTCDLESRDHPGEAMDLEQALRGGGTVRELGCGTGRTSIGIARAGLPAVGIDPALAMLAHAAGKSVGLPARAQSGATQTFARRERLGSTLMSGSAWKALLTDADKRRALANIHRRPLPGGCVTIETRNPGARDLGAQVGPHESFRHRNVCGDEVRFAATQRFEPTRHWMHWAIHRSGRSQGQAQHKVWRVLCRCAVRPVLEAAPHAEGFVILRRWGDRAGGASQAASRRIILLVARD
jgi:SAM-dependent methyltransferase